jgi:ATP phosphoribosyltransferase regulatory subunit
LAATLIALLDATGAAEHTVAQLAELTLPPKARIVLDRLIDTVAAVREICPDLRMTVDPVEFRGWKYHTGVCVTLFAVGRSEELGRGGRYLCNDNEPACGLTLRPDVLFRMIPPTPARARVYLAADASRQEAAALRSQGYATVRGFADGAQAEAEARHLGCGIILSGTQRVDLA